MYKVYFKLYKLVLQYKAAHMLHFSIFNLQIKVLTNIFVPLQQGSPSRRSTLKMKLHDKLSVKSCKTLGSAGNGGNRLHTSGYIYPAWRSK